MGTCSFDRLSNLERACKPVESTGNVSVRHIQDKDPLCKKIAEFMKCIGIVLLVLISGGILGLFFIASLQNRVGHGQKNMERMIKNQEKAIREHREQCDSKSQEVYISDLTLSPEELRAEKSNELEFHYSEATHQGYRRKMEDAHFDHEMEGGRLIGVFDGHGGRSVSRKANELFPKLFPKALKETNGDVHQAFTIVFQKIQRKVALCSAGSTAVVSYIDKATHQIFTATLGDSEANIYRKDENASWVSIPLSCVRDWLSPKDRRRLEKCWGKRLVDMRAERGGAKGVRSKLNTGVNLSRALGDRKERGSFWSPLVISKPKITVNQLKPGDVLILACDGLKDFVRESELVQTVADQEDERELATRLQSLALRSMNQYSCDNITVVAVEVLT